MTAINVVVQRKARAAFIISDTAVTAPDGTLVRSVGKVIFSVKHGFPWAMGVTGNVAPEVLLKAIGEEKTATLKQLEKRLPLAMRRAVAETCDLRGVTPAEIFCQVKGAYWDFSRKRPMGMMMQANAGDMVGAGAIEAYTWYDLPWAMGTHEAAEVLLGRAVDLEEPDSFDAEHDGYALIKAQRQRGGIDITPGMEAGHCRIGGEVHLTEVRKTGVQVYVIGDFVDQIGERIVASA
ncbi:hypothetical protein PQ455_00760 [Sphingomonas naphthae]|uniref:Uncharacterized protein n=1 Tax=Sphingomonas naphthae TaxID=1813468 RepID=A0ABY7TM78_9SPHN|nr:hypothetical protein [Sphingomonas naphthae]WCT73797.1 hypothetical protein PQ455_00760 [Sphingomonas naphthae]